MRITITSLSGFFSIYIINSIGVSFFDFLVDIVGCYGNNSDISGSANLPQNYFLRVGERSPLSIIFSLAIFLPQPHK
ncbi:MAG: hypothetical protein WBA93_05250 [Microcoleaceae cyanobacterium]